MKTMCPKPLWPADLAVFSHQLRPNMVVEVTGGETRDDRLENVESDARGVSGVLTRGGGAVRKSRGRQQ